MSELKFRNLNADEVEARAGQEYESGLTLLLYKNARVDMAILDETVGPMNWQRDHKEIKGTMYAGIGIWDESKAQWVWKWDAGTESRTEKEKGEASDSFKRAGTNWGIGRELYKSPFIWIKKEFLRYNSKDKLTTKFEVTYLESSEDKEVTCLVVAAKNKGEPDVVAFSYGKPKEEKKPSAELKAPKKYEVKV